MLAVWQCSEPSVSSSVLHSGWKRAPSYSRVYLIHGTGNTTEALSGLENSSATTRIPAHWLQSHFLGSREEGTAIGSTWMKSRLKSHRLSTSRITQHAQLPKMSGVGRGTVLFRMRGMGISDYCRRESVESRLMPLGEGDSLAHK
jgi:hypothetical protein